MHRRRSRRYLILAFVLGAAYLLFFPRPSGKEGYFRPVWSRAVPGSPAQVPQAAERPAAGEQRLSWFRAGGHFGFVRLDGELQYFGQVLHGVALSELGFINYPRVADNFVFQDPAGRLLFAARGHGYPVLDPSGELLYSVSTDLTSLRRLDRDGEPLWSVEFFSPITTLALSGEECAVGLLDGTLKLLDGQGRIAQDYVPEASRIPVVLGAALSPGRLAMLSGIDPQRLTLLERRGGELVAGESTPSGSNLRREALMRFTEDGLFLAYEIQDGLALRELKRGAEARLPGRPLAFSSSAQGLAAEAARQGDGCLLRVLRPTSSILYRRQLAFGELFLRFLDGSLLLGLPGRLLRADYLEG